MREWGFLFFDNPNFLRHIVLKDIHQLLDFCKRLGPSDCYHSAAYYTNPAVPDMSEKNWVGCDLIFDVDADHLDTPCKKDHDIWICNKCNNEGKGNQPTTCPKCSGKDISKITWICDNCLNTAKKEIIKVVDEFLISDLNLNPENIFITFSGHRGYHIHVEEEKIKKLDSNARREIIDYITGNGVDPTYQGLAQIPGGLIIGPKSDDYGWRGRINKYAVRFLKEADESKLTEIGLTKPKRKLILENREFIVENLSSTNKFIPGVNGISWDVAKLKINDWLKIVEAAVKLYAGKVDEPVTADTHRLIRLPNSLNGKSGFKTELLRRDELEAFNPLNDAQVFTGYVKVKIKRAPRIVIDDTSYGPFYDEEADLPMSVGVFLACKNLADILTNLKQ
ncbi:MAG: hypothetical protein OdinLCB4_003900 [Candidatus Odinarchaeum yellowstonii]|uniref:DNA primase small subunit PriS n=1 Tax=Odinarchaeota yellowstonii (strain LCB_4) TaxID=1841599 RepID=A0AAF0D0R1_ODILC|nr:MAG: hypothetical protein OdinLCB4_003900 [Candidatus Odinarchaeum yellowstonii]